MKTGTQLAGQALTEMRARPTPEKPVNTLEWANWLGLETFSEPQLCRLVEATARFCRGVKVGTASKPFWLVLLGTSGGGKTHCAKRIWETHKDLLSHDRCRYLPRLVFWPAFIEKLRENVREGHGIGEFLDMAQWPMLVLDDIGAGQDKTGFASDKLNTLLSCRVGRWTVITSNLSMEGIAAIDTRIASRMVREPGNIVVDLNVQDYGLRK